MNDAILLELATLVSIGFLAMGMVAYGYGARACELDERVQRLEARIYRLMQHDGVKDPPELLERARKLAQNGDQTGAIREYRKQTGADDQTAKAAVEQMAKSAKAS